MKIAFLILLIGVSANASTNAETFDLPCRFAPKQRELADFIQCARQNPDGAIKIAPKLQSQMSYDSQGISEIVIEGDCYLRSKAGKMKKTYCFENNSPDTFSEGLVRYVGANGKFGFMDKNLKVVIPPQFDFAFPFQNGIARFCSACKIKSLNDADHHSVMEGGTWGTVDRKGKITAVKN